MTNLHTCVTYLSMPSTFRPTSSLHLISRRGDFHHLSRSFYASTISCLFSRISSLNFCVLITQFTSFHYCRFAFLPFTLVASISVDLVSFKHLRANNRSGSPPFCAQLWYLRPPLFWTRRQIRILLLLGHFLLAALSSHLPDTYGVPLLAGPFLNLLLPALMV